MSKIVRLYLTYGDSDSLGQIPKEYREVKKGFEQSGFIDSDYDTYTTREHITTQIDLFSANLEFFGYSGHAHPDSLGTVDEETKSKGLSQLLSVEACPNIKVVFLNGCSTAMHVQDLLDNGIPVIIATTATIEDGLAKLFAKKLFEKLHEKKTIGQAFEKAIHHVKSKNDTITNEKVKVEERGLELREFKKNEWRIYYQHEDALKWQLTDFPSSKYLFNRPEYATKRKIFFVNDDLMYEKFYTYLNYVYDDNHEFILFSTGEIKDDKDVKTRSVTEHAKLADIIVLLVNGPGFFSIWKDWSEVSGIIQAQKKPWFFVHLGANSKDDKIKLEKELGASSAELPRHVSFLQNVATLTPNQIIDFLKDDFRNDLEEKLLQILNKSKVKEEVFKNELIDFDFEEAKQAFRVIRRKNLSYHLIMIEGTVHCGQNLLVNRLLKMTDSKKDAHRIPFISNEKYVNELELESRILGYLTIFNKENNSSLAKVMQNALKIQPIFLIFDDVITSDMIELEQINNNLNILSRFWEKLCKDLDKIKTSHDLYIFVLNRGFSVNRCFREVKGIEINPYALAEILPSIKIVNKEKVSEWVKDNSYKFIPNAVPVSTVEIINSVDEGPVEKVIRDVCKAFGVTNFKIFENNQFYNVE